ncbi:MAG: thioredoxin family protein [Cyclobacteriaceae bacterium]|nr:thioredoxin family protein [Cyclobacteriaceae bacterium]
MKALFTFCACLIVLVAAAPIKNGYEIGDTVADFRLKNVDGKMIALSDYKDAKGVIVIFDCNTCPYSKAYNSRIIALHAKYAAQGFPVVTINPNDPTQSPGDSFERMVQQAKQKGYTFPYLVDESQEVSRAFGATNTPHVFIVQRINREFKVVYIGAIDDSAKDESATKRKYVEEAIDGLLQGKPITSTRTKAIGCTIKWKNA